MKSVKECIAHALAGVQPIPKEFLELDGVDKNAVDGLLSATAKPIKLGTDEGLSIEYIERIIRLYIQSGLGNMINSVGKDCEDYLYYRDGGTLYMDCADTKIIHVVSATPSENKYRLRLYVDIYDAYQNKLATIDETQCRSTKISTSVRWLVDTLLKNPVLKKHGIEQIPFWNIERDVKSIVNKIKECSESYYVYFVNTDYNSHYYRLCEAESINSCISYRADYYGNLPYNRDKGWEGRKEIDYDNDEADDIFISPMYGYDYSPSFVLALCSKYSPDELQAVLDSDRAEEYPFIARAILHYRKREAQLACTKIYGNEIASSKIRKQFLDSDKPFGCYVFGYLCGGTQYNKRNHSNASARAIDMLSDRVGSKYALVTAPYIDTYANNLTVASNKLCSHPETGRLCILLKVSKFKQTTSNYNIYTSDGLIREVLDSDGDRTRSVIYDVASEVLLCDIT